ncbi:hypothetical protein, partial [Escherichia coli]|uniref:hypothetical protein n=1 Tax=Escherichia coli TaxID=562 RepID=UPI0019645B44
FGRLSTKPARRVGERPSNFGFDQQGHFKQVKKGERFLIVEPGTLSLTRASLFIKFYRRYIWVVIYMELVALQIII